MSQLLIGIILFGVMGLFMSIAFVSCFCSRTNNTDEEKENRYYSFKSNCNNIIARV